MNPKLPASAVSRAIANDAPRGRAEFLNTWREDVADFLPIDIIEAATSWGVTERPPVPGITYTAFADAASGTGQDSFALAIGHAEGDGRTVVIDLIRERKPRFVAEDVISEYADILRGYGISEIISDAYAAGFSSDGWRRNEIRFRKSANVTAENYLCALPMLTSRRGLLVDDQTLRAQLSGLERRVLSGRETVSHPQMASAHDDVAAAVCGCLVEAASNAQRYVRPAPVSVVSMAGAGSHLIASNTESLGGEPAGGGGFQIDWSNPDDPMRKAILGIGPKRPYGKG